MSVNDGMAAYKGTELFKNLEEVSN